MLMEPVNAPARALLTAIACILREVLAASKQVNLPVITGKLHVTQVNCARDLFTCELHVKLPAIAGNFARANFTVYMRIVFPQCETGHVSPIDIYNRRLLHSNYN